MTSIQTFLSSVMKNDFKRDENNMMVKYYNKDFDLLVQKKKDGKMNDTGVVVDRRNQPIIYNELAIALDRLNIKN